MHEQQQAIIRALQVTPAFADEAALQREIERRKVFIKDTLRASGLKVLVLGISGGVDSSTAGRLAQLSVQELREETGDSAWRFIAVRLPHNTQHDEEDAQAALAFIGADQLETVNIAPSVAGIRDASSSVVALTDGRRDFVLGNVKARIRMVAQYAIANAHGGLVIGTDHAAEAVMGFFTKFGDGACDLAPLTGLVKGQVRAIAASLGAPAKLVGKVPTADLEELAPGKPDEVAHGIGYADIDAFLHGQSISPAAEAVILKAYATTQHKRDLPLVPPFME